MSNHRFHCLLLDPPWKAERGGGKIKRGADRHYPLLSTPDVIETVLRADLWRPAANAHCWMWVTNTTLANGEGQALMRALGFRPLSFVTWVKDRIGLGQYLRGRTEHLMLGVRGKGASIRTGQGVTVIHAPRTKHSRKPVEAYEMIEKVSPGPRVEFFARARREGWEAFGNEVSDE